jgi:orotidine 5'-phosphate decarboxylase subfamily 2
LIARQGAGEGIAQWVNQLLEISAPLVPAVKFQSSCFEALGWQGWRCLEEVAKKAARLGLVTIFDGKRGDISSTMASYGVATFDRLAMEVMTVQPYMGLEVIAALKPWLQRGKGIYVVWMTSNPSHHLIQLHQSASGGTVAEELLLALTAFLSAEGLSRSCGLVLGATRIKSLDPELIARAQEFPLLLPGLGEQGGDAEALGELLLRPGGDHLAPMSRSLTGVGSSQWQETIASFSLNEYFAWYEGNLRQTVKDYPVLL